MIPEAPPERVTAMHKRIHYRQARRREACNDNPSNRRSDMGNDGQDRRADRAGEDFPPLPRSDPTTRLPLIGTLDFVDPRLLSLAELLIAPLGVAVLLLLLVWLIERVLSTNKQHK